jgi:kinesin family protein 18/19
MSDSNFQVFARVRPPSDLSSSSNYIMTGDDYIILKQPYNKNIDKRESSYFFDGVFSEKLKNNEIFKKCVQPNLQDLLQGINVTFFAYGMTGSGKTHTVFGARREGEGEKGLFNLAVEDIWSKIRDNKGSVTSKFSYLEIYNENVRDLLVEGQKSLNLVEDSSKGKIND